jgi:hypothetical protein
MQLSYTGQPHASYDPAQWSLPAVQNEASSLLRRYISATCSLTLGATLHLISMESLKDLEIYNCQDQPTDRLLLESLLYYDSQYK